MGEICRDSIILGFNYREHLSEDILNNGIDKLKKKYNLLLKEDEKEENK